MTKITPQMFIDDNGSVKQTAPADLIAEIIKLSKRDPSENTPDSRRANLMLIRRFATKLSKKL